MEVIDRQVSLDAIDATVGPRPSERLVESVKRNGVIVPVILAERVSEDGELFHIIVDGNRRVAAAREAGVDTVPARIVQQASEPEIANLTLQTNNFRTSNYVTEFWALSELQRSGIDRRKLASFTGMTNSTLATREHLANLDRRLFIGVSEGRIPPTVALAAAKLDRDVQEQLAETFSRNGRLTKQDVDALTPGKNDPGELPEVDTEGRVLPGDLQVALVALARQARQRGIDPETWAEAAERAFREVERDSRDQ